MCKLSKQGRGIAGSVCLFLLAWVKGPVKPSTTCLIRVLNRRSIRFRVVLALSLWRVLVLIRRPRVKLVAFVRSILCVVVQGVTLFISLIC